MANIKSAKKRILVNETKAARNKAIKSKVKTCVKKVETAVANKDAAAAADALKVAIVEINKAGSKGCNNLRSCYIITILSCIRDRVSHYQRILTDGSDLRSVSSHGYTRSKRFLGS